MARRWVPIPVDDPDIRGLEVSAYDGEQKRRWTRPFWVPQDDQLPRDQRRAVQALIDSSMMYTQLGDRQEPGSEAEAVYRDQARDDIMAARRLRAAFNLDTEAE